MASHTLLRQHLEGMGEGTRGLLDVLLCLATAVESISVGGAPRCALLVVHGCTRG